MTADERAFERRVAAATREIAIEVLRDATSSPDERHDARSFLMEPPADYDRLTITELRELVRLGRKARGEAVRDPEPFYGDRLICTRCRGLTHDDLADLRAALAEPAP
ncbi:MAG: hypothetical protein KIT31_18625 [Deltaproteobacteria bacterium]|nr:hypothetical protein [Deltaproteobacteria bacterium]